MKSHSELRRKIEEMEEKYDEQFKVVFDHLRVLLEPPEEEEKEPIGFQT